MKSAIGILWRFPFYRFTVGSIIIFVFLKLITFSLLLLQGKSSPTTLGQLSQRQNYFLYFNCTPICPYVGLNHWKSNIHHLSKVALAHRRVPVFPDSLRLAWGTHTGSWKVPDLGNRWSTYVNFSSSTFSTYGRGSNLRLFQPFLYRFAREMNFESACHLGAHESIESNECKIIVKHVHKIILWRDIKDRIVFSFSGGSVSIELHLRPSRLVEVLGLRARQELNLTRAYVAIHVRRKDRERDCQTLHNDTSPRAVYDTLLSYDIALQHMPVYLMTNAVSVPYLIHFFVRGGRLLTAEYSATLRALAYNNFLLFEVEQQMIFLRSNITVYTFKNPHPTDVSQKYHLSECFGWT